MKEVYSELRGNILWVFLDRPRKKNAITREMFMELTNIFKNAENDEKVSIVVLTGSAKSEYYSAGSDFSPAELSKLQDSDEGNHGYKLFVDMLIPYKKPVIAVVNGPAIGISVTTLGLMDMVIANETATFHCPFSEIGVCPEAVSSKTFVEIMGHQRAALMLLFSEKLTAEEAHKAGLVTKVFPTQTFQQDVEKLLVRYSKLSLQTFKVGKKLMRPIKLQDELLAVNRKEEKKLNMLFGSADTIERITAKFMPSSKL